MPTAVPNLTLKILAVSCPLRQTLPPERSLRAAHRGVRRSQRIWSFRRPGGNGMELASSDAMAARFALPVLHSPLSFLGRLKPFFSFWKRKKRMGSKTLPVCAERRQPPLGRGGLWADEGIGPYKHNRAHGGKTIKRMPCSSLYPLGQKEKTQLSSRLSFWSG